MNITIHRAGTNYGPYSVEDIRQHLASRTLALTDLAFVEGTSEWTILNLVPGIANSLPSPPTRSPMIFAPPSLKVTIQKDGKQWGPYDIQQLNDLIGTKAVASSDLAWMEGWPSWMTVSNVPGVLNVIPRFAHIDCLDVSDGWKDIFKLMERGGWNKRLIMPKGERLTFSERFRMLNWGAFFFGPFYYLYLGLWEKAFLMFFLTFLTIGFFLPLGGLYCFAFANYDYYLYKVRRKKLW